MAKKELKKIEHIWSIICSSSSIDAEKNNITLFNVIERVQVSVHKEQPTPPLDSKKMLNMPFELISMWKKSDLEESVNAEGEAVLLDPHGQKIGSLKFPIQIKGAIRRLRTRLQFNNLVFTVAGDYTWQIWVRIDGVEYVAGQVPLEVVLLPQK